MMLMHLGYWQGIVDMEMFRRSGSRRSVMDLADNGF